MAGSRAQSSQAVIIDMDSVVLGRRLEPASPPPRLCDGRAVTTDLQTTLLHAELHFSLFDPHASNSLWGQRPLLGQPRQNAIRLRCAANDLQALRKPYAGLVHEPLLRTLRSHNGRRPFAPYTAGVALLVLPDYANLFHQFGSLVIAWAAYQESLRAAPRASNGTPATAADERAFDPAQVHIYMLSNATLAPTALHWSPGLSTRPPVFVGARPPPPAATYERVILVQPATETWWWTVWKPDTTDRRAILRALTDRLAAALLPRGAPEVADALGEARRAVVAPSGTRHESEPPPPASLPSLLLVLTRTTDRRVINEASLVAALAAAPAVRAAGLLVSAVDLGALSVRGQLALIQRTRLLIGAHGAGLLWNLFLPEQSAVLELLNRANMNEYYANHCRWNRRPYAHWQNQDPSAEEAALDPSTREPFDAFRNHVRVDEAAVVRQVQRLLSVGAGERAVGEQA